MGAAVLARPVPDGTTAAVDHVAGDARVADAADDAIGHDRIVWRGREEDSRAASVDVVSSDVVVGTVEDAQAAQLVPLDPVAGDGDGVVLADARVAGPAIE